MIKNTRKKSGYPTNLTDKRPYIVRPSVSIHLTSMIDSDGDPVILNDNGRTVWQKMVDKIPEVKKGHYSEYNAKVIDTFYPFEELEGPFSVEQKELRREALSSATMDDYFEFLEKSEQRLVVYFLGKVYSGNFNIDEKVCLDITVQEINEVTKLKLKDPIKTYQFLWNLSQKYFCLRKQRNQRPWIEFQYFKDEHTLISDKFCLIMCDWHECDFYEIVEYINNKRAFNKSLGKKYP